MGNNKGEVLKRLSKIGIITEKEKTSYSDTVEEQLRKKKNDNEKEYLKTKAVKNCVDEFIENVRSNRDNYNFSDIECFENGVIKLISFS